MTKSIFPHFDIDVPMPEGVKSYVAEPCPVCGCVDILDDAEFLRHFEAIWRNYVAFPSDKLAEDSLAFKNAILAIVQKLPPA